MIDFKLGDIVRQTCCTYKVIEGQIVCMSPLILAVPRGTGDKWTFTNIDLFVRLQHDQWVVSEIHLSFIRLSDPRYKELRIEYI